MIRYKATFITNGSWPNAAEIRQGVKDRVAAYSNNRLIIDDIGLVTSFTNIPFTSTDGFSHVDTAWYRANITPLALGQQGSLLQILPQDWSGNVQGYMDWWDNGLPARIQATAVPTESLTSQAGDISPTVLTIVKLLCHELLHQLGNLTAQEYYPAYFDHSYTHYWDYSQNNLRGGYEGLDYAKLALAIPKGDPMIGYKNPTNNTVYIMVGGGTLVPITDWQTFLNLGGSDQSIVNLTADQFSKYKVAPGAVFTKG